MSFKKKCKLYFTSKHKLLIHLKEFAAVKIMVNFKQLQNKITLSTLYCFVSKKCLQLLIKIV